MGLAHIRDIGELKDKCMAFVCLDVVNETTILATPQQWAGGQVDFAMYSQMCKTKQLCLGYFSLDIVNEYVVLGETRLFGCCATTSFRQYLKELEERLNGHLGFGKGKNTILQQRTKQCETTKTGSVVEQVNKRAGNLELL